MSIEMSAKIRWNFAFNQTDIEWHKLQHDIEKIMRNYYLFNVGKSFCHVADFEHNDADLELWARLHNDRPDVEFIVLYKREIEKQ